MIRWLATHPDVYRLLLMVLAILGLVVAVARFKWHAFIALLVASLFLGVGAGLDPPGVVKAFTTGLGNVLGSIALVIALGSVLGKLLVESGAAGKMAATLVRTPDSPWTPWSLALIAFLVGVPVFFSVGLVLLAPVVFTLARQTGRSFLGLSLPVLAGLSTVHGLAPPHPGPLAAVELLRADIGKTIFYSLLVGLPTTLLAGPWLGRRLEKVGGGEGAGSGGLTQQFVPQAGAQTAPGFWLALFTSLLPVLLMLLASAADLAFAKGSAPRTWAGLVGHPVVAMLAATLFSFWSFGSARGFDRRQLLKFSEDSLAPVAQILLVVGAGGGFSAVLTQSGVGDTLARLAGRLEIPPLLLGWLVAAAMRVATGSATVAVTTAAGLLGPLVATVPGLNRELLVVAMGAGSLILSHVNDGGFWMVKEYLNLSLPQTLKTWTVLETVLSLIALGFTLLLGLVL